MGLISDSIRREWRKEDERERELRTQMLQQIAEGNIVAFQASEELYKKELKYEISPKVQLGMIVTGLQNDLIRKMKPSAAPIHPGRVVVEPGRVTTEREIIAPEGIPEYGEEFDVHAPSKVYRGTTKAERTKAATEAAAIAQHEAAIATSQARADADLARLETIDPMKFELIKRFRASSDKDKEQYYNTTMAPSISQLANAHLKTLTSEQREPYVEAFLSTHTDKAPVTRDFITYDETTDKYFRTAKRWNGTTWEDIPGTAPFPLNDPTEMDEDELMRELMKIDGLMTSPAFTNEQFRKLMGITDEQVEYYKARRKDLHARLKEIKKARGEVVEEEEEGVVSQIQKLRMKDGEAVLE